MFAIWPKLIFQSLPVFGAAVGVVFYKIKNDVCHAFPSPKASGIPWDSNWDGQALKAKRNLLLIRHGDYDVKDANLPLTEKGKIQAQVTGMRLCQLGLPYTRLIHSSMLRAIQTAEIIGKCLPPIPVFFNNEICEGVPNAPDPPVPNWTPNEEQLLNDPPRIEFAFRQLVRRADYHEQDDTFEIIVCHANVIRFFVCRALQFSPAAWLRFTLNNCSITWIVIHPDGRVELKACGDSGHLPLNLLSA